MTESSNPINVPLYFHTILFAYQKSLRDKFGQTEGIFARPVLETIAKIDKESKIHVIRGNNLDEILENFSRDVMSSQAVNKAFFEKVGDDDYVFHIEGCAFSKPVHDMLKPKDAICPLAMIAMSVFHAATGKRLRTLDSEFTSDGCMTKIH